MWTDNTRNAKIRGGGMKYKCLRYRMVMKILILIFFFKIKKSQITRGNNFTLVKNQSRLDVRKFSFSQRTINVWNTLSTGFVHASSVNMFKNRLDKYLVKAGYT